MSIRASRAFRAFFILLLAQNAQAQAVDSFDAPPDEIDEFDLGDEWVDGANEGGWYAPWTPLFGSEPGSFRLDVSGGIGLDVERTATVDQEVPTATDRAGARQEYYALATLQIPLERFFGGGAGDSQLRRLRGEEPQLLAQYDGGDVERSEQQRRRADQPETRSTVVPTPLMAGEDGSTSEADRTAKESRAEPVDGAPKTEVVVAEDLQPMFTPELSLLLAREIADRVTVALSGAEGRIRSLIRRSRLSGLSPELRLRGVLGFDRATSTEESVGIYPGDTTVRGGRDSLAEARLTFRLDRLVLGDGEPSLERQRIDLAAERRKLTQEALEFLFDWRLASSRASDVSLPPDERVQAGIEADAALAELHLLTGGWFRGVPTIRRLSREVPNASASPEQ